MTPRSQGSSVEMSGRANQKRRTRNALIAAGQALLDRGESPTVAQAAEEALVSRTTAYRYFPTQESLLMELSLVGTVDKIDELVANPAPESTPTDRLLELADAFNRFVATNEVLYRTAQRLYLDQWLAAERAGSGHDAPLRQGRRRQWISAAFGPLRHKLSKPDYRRLEAALCLVMGGEAYVALRDVCQLEPEEAIAVSRWAAQAILAAAPVPNN